MLQQRLGYKGINGNGNGKVSNVIITGDYQVFSICNLYSLLNLPHSIVLVVFFYHYQIIVLCYPRGAFYCMLSQLTLAAMGARNAPIAVSVDGDKSNELTS